MAREVRATRVLGAERSRAWERMALPATSGGPPVAHPASQLLKEESVDGSAVQRALKDNPTTGGLEKVPPSSVAPAREIIAVI